MENIAYTVFGTCNGVNGFPSPKTFQLPIDLKKIVDTSLPFLWDVEVFRFYRVPTRGDETLNLFALYQKIDDFSGPRSGSFAGVGVFVRNGTVNSKVLVAILRDMLANLLDAATDTKKFIRDIDEGAAKGLIKPPSLTQQEQLLASLRNAPFINETYEPSRMLIAMNDVFVDSPERLFEINQSSTLLRARDIYYCSNHKFHDAALQQYSNYDVTTVSLEDMLRKYDKSKSSREAEMARASADAERLKASQSEVASLKAQLNAANTDRETINDNLGRAINDLKKSNADKNKLIGECNKFEEDIKLLKAHNNELLKGKTALQDELSGLRSDSNNTQSLSNYAQEDDYKRAGDSIMSKPALIISVTVIIFALVLTSSLVAGAVVANSFRENNQQKPDFTGVENKIEALNKKLISVSEKIDAFKSSGLPGTENALPPSPPAKIEGSARGANNDRATFPLKLESGKEMLVADVAGKIAEFHNFAIEDKCLKDLEKSIIDRNRNDVKTGKVIGGSTDKKIAYVKPATCNIKK